MIPTPTVLRRDQWKTMPWRNGRGITHEIWPGDRVVADDSGFFVHRTPLTEDAVFSAYDGFDRVLIPLVGAGLLLVIDGTPVPAAVGRAVRFRGEAKVEARVGDPSTEVFNLIYDRGVWRETPDAKADVTIVHALSPGIEFSADGGRHRLQQNETYIGPSARLPAGAALHAIRLGLRRSG